jgi:thiosulfate/3-mercaptopyruvate sulfurtransferase
MNICKAKLTVLLAAVMMLAIITGCSAVAGSKSGDMKGSDSKSLVSIDWLAKTLNKSGVVILDVGDFTNYEKNHIPGAIKAFGPWQTMNDEFVGFMTPKTDDLVEMLRNYGVNNDSKIIIYDEGITSMDTCRSARALWTLQMLGHNDVAILDGGFAAWEQSGKPVSNVATTPTSLGNFSAKPLADKVATLADVKKKIGSKTVFLDNRVSTEFFGHEKKSHIKRYGHLPNALTWPSNYMSNAGIKLSPAFMKDTKVLAQMAAGVGIPADKNAEIITYSNHGLQAAMGYFVLHDLLGYKNVKIFDGSILEVAPDKSVAMKKFGW